MYMYCASDMYHLIRWYYGFMTRHTAESILSISEKVVFLSEIVKSMMAIQVVRSAVLYILLTDRAAS